MAQRYQPAPADGVELHLYRLEHLFQTLHELWSEKRAGNRVAHRWLRAVVGFGSLAAVPEVPNSLAVTLEAGSRMCNAALAALARREPGDAECEQQLVGLRDLLIAVHDLLETTAQPDYPLEHDAARGRLTELTATEGDDDQLIESVFARGGIMATAAIAGLQSRHAGTAGSR